MWYENSNTAALAFFAASLDFFPFFPFFPFLEAVDARLILSAPVGIGSSVDDILSKMIMFFNCKIIKFIKDYYVTMETSRTISTKQLDALNYGSKCYYNFFQIRYCSSVILKFFGVWYSQQICIIILLVAIIRDVCVDSTSLLEFIYCILNKLTMIILEISIVISNYISCNLIWYVNLLCFNFS